MRKSVVFFAVLCIGLGAVANVLEQGPRTERGGGGCPDWMCSTNGTHLSGIVLESTERALPAGRGDAVAAKRAISGGVKRGGCDDFGCGTSNGTSLDGLAFEVSNLDGFPLTRAADATVLAQGVRTTGGGGGCPNWTCTVNGTQLTGIILESIEQAPATRSGYAVAAKQTISGGVKRGCDDFGCGTSNGTSRNGFAPKDLDLEQIQLRATEVLFTQRTSR